MALFLPSRRSTSFTHHRFEERDLHDVEIPKDEDFPFEVKDAFILTSLHERDDHLITSQMFSSRNIFYDIDIELIEEVQFPFDENANSVEKRIHVTFSQQEIKLTWFIDDIIHFNTLFRKILWKMWNMLICVFCRASSPHGDVCKFCMRLKMICYPMFNTCNVCHLDKSPIYFRCNTCDLHRCVKCSQFLGTAHQCLVRPDIYKKNDDSDSDQEIIDGNGSPINRGHRRFRRHGVVAHRIANTRSIRRRQLREISVASF